MTEVWCHSCYGAGYLGIINTNNPLGFVVIVCPTCKGQGTLNKGEIQMSEENNQETTSSPLDAVQQEINKLKSEVEQEINKLKLDLDAEEVRSRGYRDEMYKLRNTVHEFFKDQFDGGDDEITVHRDEANELLGDIGADLLKQEFEGRVTITYSFTVQAESEDEAREIVENAVSSLESQIDAGNDDSYSEESIEVDF
jgi:DnaJ-class molecular chaperone